MDKIELVELVDSEFSKVLTYNDLVLCNLGYIIGAGIFVLIGKTLNIAGSSAWISVIISGLFIYLISNVYISVHNKYKQNNAEILSINNTLGENVGKFTVVITLIAITFISYVVILAFGDYLEAFTNGYISSYLACIIGLLSTVICNVYGINFTVKINIIITLSGILGLLIIIILGAIYIVKNFSEISKNLIIHKFDPLAILYGAFIFIFAYIGFEMIIRLNNESINGERDIPDAIHDSIWITIVLYTLLTIIMIAVFDSHMTMSNRPFVDLIMKLTTNQYIIKYIEYCGIALTWTSILFAITQTSRILRDFFVAEQFNYLAEINATTKTPVNCIFIITIVIILLLLKRMNLITGTVIANGCLILSMGIVYLSVKTVKN
jgi:APA family basic amino acid/polyamine antiporter